MRQLQAEITSAEFSEWIAYDLLHPIGDEPIEHIIAELCAVMVNMHKRQDDEPATPNDFKYRRLVESEPVIEVEPEVLDQMAHAFFKKRKEK